MIKYSDAVEGFLSSCCNGVYRFTRELAEDLITQFGGEAEFLKHIESSNDIKYVSKIKAFDDDSELQALYIKNNSVLKEIAETQVRVSGSADLLNYIVNLHKSGKHGASSVDLDDVAIGLYDPTIADGESSGRNLKAGRVMVRFGVMEMARRYNHYQEKLKNNKDYYEVLEHPVKFGRGKHSEMSSKLAKALVELMGGIVVAIEVADECYNDDDYDMTDTLDIFFDSEIMVQFLEDNKKGLLSFYKNQALDSNAENMMDYLSRAILKQRLSWDDVAVSLYSHSLEVEGGEHVRRVVLACGMVAQAALYVCNALGDHID